MGTRRAAVSVRDVAARAGVSIGTVSNTLNAPHLVSADTRARIEAAIDDLGWVPNESARQLRVGRSRSIAMVVMDITNPFFTDLVLGAEDCLEDQGYSVQVSNSADEEQREQRHLTMLEQQRVAGVLYAPVSGVAGQMEQLRRRGIPVVLLDRTGQREDACSVAVDDVEGGRLALEHLLGLGHRHVGLVGARDDRIGIQRRMSGAELACSSYDGSVRLTEIPTSRDDAASGVQAARTLLAMPAKERPTAVFAINDRLAIGVMQCCVAEGIRVPEDLAIVGYDDVSFAASAAVPLTSIRQPRQALGRRAAELLLREIEADDSSRAHRHESVEFAPELIVRQSTSGMTGDPVVSPAPQSQRRALAAAACRAKVASSGGTESRGS